MNHEPRREPGWQAADPAGPPALGPWATQPDSRPDPSFNPWTQEPPTQDMGVRPPMPAQWAPMPPAPPVSPPAPPVSPGPPVLPAPPAVGPPAPSWGPPPADMWSGGGRRVVPLPPPPKRTGLVKGLLIGLAVGLVVAGAGGYLVGSTLGGGAAASPGPSAAASPSLPAYEASQLALNKPKFDGDLTVLAQPWLPWMGGCATNTDIDGPTLQPGEAKHVFCRYGGVSVHFAQFKSTKDRDLARTYREQLNLSSDGLAPGQAPPGHKTGGVSGVQGNYVEYSFKENDGRVLCGIWWDREAGTAALMLETLCEEGLGGSWDPLRDLWRRHT